MKNHTLSLLHTRTRLQAGNAASNECYALRNGTSFGCTVIGWPQTEYVTLPPAGPLPNPCLGNKNEMTLMDCLDFSGEANWWKDFAGCTSAEQCKIKAKNKHEALIKYL